MKAKKKVYIAASGSQFDRTKVQIYGQEIEKIAEENNGTLTPIQVVDKARDVKSNLHEIFDWDDDSAAEKYRLEQARHLINHIVVKIQWDGKEREIKSFYNLNTIDENGNDEKKVYVTVDRALSERPLREQILLNALEEVEYWKQKYETYRELNMVFSSIRKTKKKIVSKLRKKRVKKGSIVLGGAGLKRR